MSLLERLRAPGPKRILSLDGGGIRGALTLGYLERIEKLLQERHSNPRLRLCDYFDLIGGTSTGSIIAGGLAIGMSVAQVKEKYLTLGEKVFSRNKWWKLHRAFFDPTKLRAELEGFFGNRRMEDPTIETGLCIVAKRVDTGSTWPLINHPEGKFYKYNKDLLLRQVIRASTAAPTYFETEELDVGNGIRGVFVDGGVSMANNPSLQLFLVATLRGFPFHWPTGENNLLLVSVGTGTWQLNEKVDVITGAWLKTWAQKVPSLLMDDANWQNQLMLQYLSRTKTPWQIDGEVEELEDDLLTPEPALSYLRYNTRLEENGLNALDLGNDLERLKKNLQSLREMSVGKNSNDLYLIGQKAAQKHVFDEHFPAAFNLTIAPPVVP